jgi:hypothetical protein
MRKTLPGNASWEHALVISSALTVLVLVMLISITSAAATSDGGPFV